jgi:hypothetical protein
MPTPPPPQPGAHNGSGAGPLSYLQASAGCATTGDFGGCQWAGSVAQRPEDGWACSRGGVAASQLRPSPAPASSPAPAATSPFAPAPAQYGAHAPGVSATSPSLAAREPHPFRVRVVSSAGPAPSVTQVRVSPPRDAHIERISPDPFFSRQVAALTAFGHAPLPSRRLFDGASSSPALGAGVIGSAGSGAGAGASADAAKSGSRATAATTGLAPELSAAVRRGPVRMGAPRLTAVARVRPCTSSRPGSNLSLGGPYAAPNAAASADPSLAAHDVQLARSHVQASAQGVQLARLAAHFAHRSPHLTRFPPRRASLRSPDGCLAAADSAWPGT